MTTQIVYSKEFHKHDNSSHPENAQRLTVMMNEVKQTPFYNDLDFIEPILLSEELLHAVHSDDMIQRIKDISLQGDSWVDMDTYVCKGDYKIARLAAGGLLQLCNNVIDGNADNAYALIRPPGHHATKQRSMGFCLFNNAADPDVHHGNGTQDIFYDRNDVLYQSIHLSPHYPGTGSVDELGTGDGEGYTNNAPLSYGNGNNAVSIILDDVFLPIAHRFKPDLIIFSTGFDSHHADQLGGLKLTANFYGAMIKKYQKIQPKIVSTLEGGYNFQWIGKCLVSQLGQLVSHPLNIDDHVQEDTNVQPLVEKMKKELEKYWKL